MASETSITIRKIPSETHQELAARAAQSGRSLQEFLRGELVRIAQRPTTTEMLDRVRRRKAITKAHLTPEQILAHREAERR